MSTVSGEANASYARAISANAIVLSSPPSAPATNDSVSGVVVDVAASEAAFALAAPGRSLPNQTYWERLFRTVL